jgi:glycosyltransferase involved in cell wall biosynthesis
VIGTCVITHNRLAYSQKCIGSLLETQRPGDQLVIVDNASDDGTREWLATRPVKVIYNDTNRYPGAACNQGWDTLTTPLLHRSDNDIEYLPGWQDEVELHMTEGVALLGILNLHEDIGHDPEPATGFDLVDAVGGNVVIPAALYPSLRWDESPWGVVNFEDAAMSVIARQFGWVARLRKTVANNMSFCRYDDYPDYYQRTARIRGLGDARTSV